MAVSVQNYLQSGLPVGYTGSASTVIGYTGSKGDIGYTGSVGFTGSVGSISATGANTQILYNNSGAVGASANFTFDQTNSTLTLGGTDPEVILGNITNEPASPSAGNLTVYSKSIGGRSMLKIKGPSGLDTPLQPIMAMNKMSFWSPPGNTTTVPAIWGFEAMSSVANHSSTTTARTVATTNVLTRTKRLGYVGSTGTSYYTGIYHPQAQWTVGDGSGLGGFYLVARFSLPNANAGHAFFVGLGSGTSNQTNGTAVDPATLTNSIGVGASTGDTNLRIFYGGSSAQTPVATNANFPKVSTTSIFEIILYAPPSANNTVYYRLSRFASGSSSFEISGTLTGTAGTALPASTTFLTPRLWTHSGSSGVRAELDVVSIYLESDY